MDYDSAFSALQYIRKPSIGKFMTEITKVEGFGFTFIPFMLGGSELISHHFALN